MIKFLKSAVARLAGLRGDLGFFFTSIAMVGFSESMVNSTFNNFLNDSFHLDSLQRTFLELPRELPGFLIIFISAALFFIRSRRLAVLAMLTGAAGLVLIALLSVNFQWMFVWLFVFSLGQHLFMPLSTSIGMDLAHAGRTGKRLGQLNAVRNVAVIGGSFFVFLGFQYFRFDFRTAFLIAAAFYLLSGGALYLMHPGKSHPPAVHLQFHREYRLYYLLSILFGTRKQIFLTFAPWVLVTVFHQPTAMVATLLTAGGVAGIVFQPALGWAIDNLGEKIVLIGEALLLIIVCLGYGFSRNIFPESVAFWIAAACYVMDQLLLSVNAARSTYMKKIAVRPEHVTPTLTLSVSLDHFFSITVALTGGLIWARLGYQTVFLLGAGIALLNLFAAMAIQIPEAPGLQKTKKDAVR